METLPPSVNIWFWQGDNINLVDGVFHRYCFRPEGGEEVNQLILPEYLKQEVLEQLHQNYEHQGIGRTTELGQQQCYWPGLRKEIEQ